MAARTCLITGAHGGIGRAVAARLSAGGHRVVRTGRSARPGSIAADLTEPGAVDEMFAAAEAAHGPVEVLVLAAGAGASAPLARTTDGDWARMLELNLTVPFRCIRRAVPAMTERGWGRIVLVASMAAKRGDPYVAAYTASKHGALGLVRSAASELAGTGVTVNAVCPGYVDTPMADGIVANIVATTGRTEAEARRALERRQPIGRLVTPEEVADAVDLCVRNPAINGQGINVDGGAVQS